MKTDAICFQNSSASDPRRVSCDSRGLTKKKLSSRGCDVLHATSPPSLTLTGTTNGLRRGTQFGVAAREELVTLRGDACMSCRGENFEMFKTIFSKVSRLLTTKFLCQFREQFVNYERTRRN